FSEMTFLHDDRHRRKMKNIKARKAISENI
ncbi:MAG: hypothetical protein ACI923_001848, partial [Flavobacteriales bacterium]